MPVATTSLTGWAASLGCVREGVLLAHEVAIRQHGREAFGVWLDAWADGSVPL